MAKFLLSVEQIKGSFPLSPPICQALPTAVRIAKLKIGQAFFKIDERKLYATQQGEVAQGWHSTR